MRQASSWKSRVVEPRRKFRVNCSTMVGNLITRIMVMVCDTTLTPTPICHLGHGTPRRALSLIYASPSIKLIVRLHADDPASTVPAHMRIRCVLSGLMNVSSISAPPVLGQSVVVHMSPSAFGGAHVDITGNVLAVSFLRSGQYYSFGAAPWY
jgi:hypothetical protein